MGHAQACPDPMNGGKSMMIPTEPGHPCSSFWSDGRFDKVPVRWMNLNSPTDPEFMSRDSPLGWGAVCGYSHRIFALAKSALLPLAVHEISVSKTGACAEGERCLARQCPLNRTSPARLKWLLGLKRKQPVAETIPLTDARYCELFRHKPTVGGVFIDTNSLLAGYDLSDLLSVLHSFHMEAVAGGDTTSVDQSIGGLWAEPSDSTGSCLAFVPAGRSAGLSLLAAAIAEDVERSTADGVGEQEWLSNFFRLYPRNRDTRRACSRAVSELKGHGRWRWPPTEQ